jgi:hypothetical protein
MEERLDLYAEPEDPQRPVACFDERPYQMVGETCQPLPREPGRPQRFDYEYQRHGTANLFIVFQPLAGWRRTKRDFAGQRQAIVDGHFPQAERIRVVLDNLNTHTPAALYEAFPPAEARRILRKLELHYTPKHGSWLTMPEIELSVLSRQCLARRVLDRATLEREVAAWAERRNAAAGPIDWRFTTDDARIRLTNLYPSGEG